MGSEGRDARRTALAALAAVVRELGGAPADAVPLPGGSVNLTRRIRTADGDLVVRVPRDPLREDEFPVEEWAVGAAARAGIPVAPVVARGVRDGVPWIASRFVEADPVPTAAPWARLGGYARALASVDVRDAPASLFTRFGRDLPAAWAAHVAYGIASLTDDDPLLRDGAYPAACAPWLRARFTALAATPFAHGLAHGDLAPRNLLSRGHDGRPVLLDWGAAETGPTPWTDARRVTAWALLDGTITRAEHDAFLRAAGLADSEAQRTLVAMTALHLVDVTRWARERRPDLHAGYVRACRAGLTRLGAPGC